MVLLEGIEKNWVLSANYASGKPTEGVGALISRRPANANPVYCLQIKSDHALVLDCLVSVFSGMFAFITNA